MKNKRIYLFFTFIIFIFLNFNLFSEELNINASKIKYTKIEAVLTLLKEREGEELGSILCTIDVEAGDNIETLTTSY